MHLNPADQGLTYSSDQTAKMHLDEGIKALQGGDLSGVRSTDAIDTHIHLTNCFKRPGR
jgi:hypothetical protein